MSTILEINLKNPKPGHMDKLVSECYNALELITFYTIKGGKESRAWTVKKGTKAARAGGVVHSDFEEKFIKAQIVNWKSLVEAGSWLKARQLGLVKTVGRDYVLQDGDVIEFKI